MYVRMYFYPYMDGFATQPMLTITSTCMHVCLRQNNDHNIIINDKYIVHQSNFNA